MSLVCAHCRVRSARGRVTARALLRTPTETWHEDLCAWHQDAILSGALYPEVTSADITPYGDDSSTDDAPIYRIDEKVSMSGPSTAAERARHGRVNPGYSTQDTTGRAANARHHERRAG